MAEIENWIRSEATCVTIVTPHTEENMMQLRNVKATIIANDVASNLHSP